MRIKDLRQGLLYHPSTNEYVVTTFFVFKNLAIIEICLKIKNKKKKRNVIIILMHTIKKNLLKVFKRLANYHLRRRRCCAVDAISWWCCDDAMLLYRCCLFTKNESKLDTGFTCIVKLWMALLLFTVFLLWLK